jgi:predicted NBD/HSP70 family sugar kinase
VTTVVGIDVGATKLAAARVDVERGTLVGARRRPTRPTRGPRAVLDDCIALARELAAGDVPAAVGMGVCELVDVAGRVRSAETLDWRGIDVAAELSVIAPAVVESDVRAAALAEARFGAGREQPDFLYVSIGTGISHCLVEDGRPRAGAHGSAIGTGAPLVERWSGGLALARRTGHPDAAAALADPQSEATVDDAARRLGAVLAALVNALDPGAVVFGGGLGLRAAYRDRVVAAMRAGTYDPAARQLPALAAALGADAGIIGAALAAWPPRAPHPRGPAGTDRR